jgi:hypothetical protein
MLRALTLHLGLKVAKSGRKLGVCLRFASVSFPFGQVPARLFIGHVVITGVSKNWGDMAEWPQTHLT